MNGPRRPRHLAPLVLGMAACALLQGCGFFGYYKYERPERIPREQGERIRDPLTFETTNTLDGPTLAAFQVALKDFFPPNAKATGNDERLVRCLNRRDVYDVRIQKVNDDLYVIYFSPNLGRCDMPAETVLLDGDATYLIDGKGRILDIR